VSRKSTVGRLVAALLGSGIATVIAEVGLRAIRPIDKGLGIAVVDAAHPVAHFAPNTDSPSRPGPHGEPVAISTNNVGFRNDQDYELDPSTPLLALVGDSYVTAVGVPHDETIAAWLTRGAESAGRVYSFAVRGAGFAQYLVWAEYARDHFAPDTYAFVVIANDFGDSVNARPGFHHFERNAEGGSELVRVNHHPSWERRLASHSALASFLMNRRVLRKWFPRTSHKLLDPAHRFVSNIPAELPEDVLEHYRWAFDSTLERLPEATGVTYDRILFVVDGFRPNMYEQESLDFAETSAWAELREYAIARAEEVGIEVVDLHASFMAEYEHEGRRFESAGDNHWNPYGHRSAAAAAMESHVFQDTFGLDG
jgi:hypothetical protein